MRDERRKVCLFALAAEVSFFSAFNWLKQMFFYSEAMWQMGKHPSRTFTDTFPLENPSYIPSFCLWTAFQIVHSLVPPHVL